MTRSVISTLVGVLLFICLISNYSSTKTAIFSGRKQGAANNTCYQFFNRIGKTWDAKTGCMSLETVKSREFKKPSIVYPKTRGELEVNYNAVLPRPAPLPCVTMPCLALLYAAPLHCVAMPCLACATSFSCVAMPCLALSLSLRCPLPLPCSALPCSSLLCAFLLCLTLPNLPGLALSFLALHCPILRSNFVRKPV